MLLNNAAEAARLGAARAKVELVKLQVSYKEVILGTQSEIKKAQEVIISLTQQRDEFKQRLAEERDLYEKNAQRIKKMEATLEALEHYVLRLTFYEFVNQIS